MIEGRAFVLGDDVDTDLLAPGAYMKFSIDVLAGHCLEAVHPRFAAEVRPGDVVVAGRAFGLGSSREQAAQALKHLGVGCVLATSFGGIFYRNAINLGLPLLVWKETASVREGDRLAVDIVTGAVENRTSGARLQGEPLPDAIRALVETGGLIPHLERRFSRERAAAGRLPGTDP